MSAASLPSRFVSTLCVSAASVLLASASFALPGGGSGGVGAAGDRVFIVDDTWWVDVDYTDIPAAVAAADEGDVIIVRSGGYSGFSVFEGIKILGDVDVKVRGEVLVSDLPAGRRAVLSNLNVEGLVVERCDSPVVLQDMTVRRPASLFGARAHLRVSDSTDVRIRRGTIGGPTGYTPRLFGLLVDHARVELTDSLLSGENGLPSGLGERNGVSGLRIERGGEAHVSRTTVVGGYGGNGDTGANGAPAIEVEGDGSYMLLTGTSVDLILGGAAGVGTGCESDGRPASGIRIGPGAKARVSGVDVRQGDDHGCVSNAVPAIDAQGSLLEPKLADPTLRLLGTPATGQVASFVLTARPGSTIQLDLGRRPVVEPVDGIEEDAMLKVLQSVPLGVVPDSGEVRFQLSLPSAFFVNPGQLVMAQGSATDADGKRLTQSIPLVLR